MDETTKAGKHQKAFVHDVASSDCFCFFFASTSPPIPVSSTGTVLVIKRVGTYKSSRLLINVHESVNRSGKHVMSMSYLSV